ncbi:MAG: electron transfer flavoprotein subunit alpha/FixB family protein [Calditrichaeota bacterium]|nr:MAG: electron transfer flavoprotein subunit alpha/FixB family protein [Calditrichota bacterium]
MSNVLVVVEQQNGNIEEVTFELLGKGRELADALGGQLAAVLLGSGVKELAGQLGAADKVLYVDHPNLANFNPDAHCAALTEVVKANQPAVTLVPYTSMGMDLASGVSAALELPLVSYGVDVAVKDGRLSVISQLYGGKINTESVVEGDSCVISVIAGSFPADAGRKEGSPAVEEIAAPESVASPRVQFKQLIEPEAGDVDITQQEILVSVGRGIQSEENLPMAEELAQVLGGAVSASRPIVDNKWLPKTRQVGKSGVKVKPKLYLALGISGAPEHIEGMKDSELIIAVNTDPNAPIFDYAHYGTTVDLFDLIPALTEKLK